MRTNFKLYSQYYDLLYQDKDYQGEAAYISRYIRDVVPCATTLLELGSGTGNHARYLCQMGYEVTGIERSAEMVEQSRGKQIVNFNPVVDDITTFGVGQRFDAAVSLFHSLCYITTNAGLLTCFRKVWQHLLPGGVFVFDLWYAPAVIADLPAPRIRRKQNDQIEVIRLADTRMLFNRNVAEVNYEIIIRNKSTGEYTTLTEAHPMRYFSIPEIEMIAACTGFKTVLAHEFMSGAEPTIKSWNILMVLQKTTDA